MARKRKEEEKKKLEKIGRDLSIVEAVLIKNKPGNCGEDRMVMEKLNILDKILLTEERNFKYLAKEREEFNR